MKRDDGMPGAEAGRIVHLAGTVNDDIFRFLCPATHALARTGAEQVVVMVDHLRYRRYLTAFHDSVDLVLSRAHRHPVRRWKEVMGNFGEVLAQVPPRAVHLHGLLPCLVGSFAVRRAGVVAPIFHSPHGLRLASVLLALKPVLGGPAPRRPRGARVVALRHAMELVEGPVARAFFDVPRNEARHPLIVTAAHRANARRSESFAQLAVLIGGDDLRIAFNWIGPADAVSKQRFKAAHVGVAEVASEAERASRLATGWIYVALDAGRGFPRGLAEAMAAGMPCVAVDHPRHRELIRHGETGLLYGTQHEMLECLAHLIDTPSTRRVLGEAARSEAQRHYSEPTFQERLLEAYKI